MAWGVRTGRVSGGVVTWSRRRNSYDADPTESKTGDPNDLIAGGGRWTFIMGVARVRGFVIASAGERIETETSTSTSGPVQWTRTTKYTEQELKDYVQENDIAPGPTIQSPWLQDPWHLSSLDLEANSALQREAEEGFIVKHPTGLWALTRAWDVGAPTTETVTETRHAKVLMGVAIPVAPNSEFLVYGVVDPGTGLLVAEYISDTPYSLPDFTLIEHAGKSDQQPPDILLEIGEPA